MQSKFVGRDEELRKIFSLIDYPLGDKRIAYLEGVGGIGKTKLIIEVLVKVIRRESKDFLVPHKIEEKNEEKNIVPSLIDFYSTDNRTVDGVRETIIQYLDDANFAEFRRPKHDTPEVFRNCLRALVKQKPVILAFDTFELVHNDPLVNWLLDDGETGLQMPGLICLIGSRLAEKDNEAKIEKSLNNPLIERIKLTGFSNKDATNFYCQLTDMKSDSLSSYEQGFIKELVLRTGGNPLLIQLVSDQFTKENKSEDGVTPEKTQIWTEEYIRNVSLEQLEKAIMKDVQDKITYSDQLYMQDRHLNTAAFNTFLSMAYLIRRFDVNILQWIVDQGFISLKAGGSVQDVIETLRSLFFVKVRDNDILQLHDEMARLVRQYLFGAFGDDISGERRREFQQAIPKLYDGLIQTAQQELKLISEGWVHEEVKLKIAQLQAERLYYMLEYGLTILKESGPIDTSELEKAYDYFVVLQDTDEDVLLKLLPGEMQRVANYYSASLRYEIYKRLARIQQHLNNLSQAELYWTEAEKYADSPEKQIETLLGRHNVVWPRNVELSLKEILPRARDLAEKKVHEMLPTVLYEFGFTYGKLQEMDRAVDYYREALEKYEELGLDDKERKATILNDMGFALARQGEYEEGQEQVGKGRGLRQEVYGEAHTKVDKQLGRLEVIPLDSDQYRETEENLIKVRDELRRASLRLGWAFSTEAQIARYDNQLSNALTHYDDALRLFREAGHEYWIALLQNRRGETLRRMAREQHEKGKIKQRDMLIQKAHEAIDESIYLGNKYNLVSQSREVFERRKGRVYHDQALWAIEKGERGKADEFLGLAEEQFKAAIQSARRMGNKVELLESEVELLFLNDDKVELRGREHDPAEVKKELRRFKQTLDKIKQSGEKIFQMDVYTYLWEIESGAYWYEVAQSSGGRESYDRALEHYVKGYVGMARMLGYGQYRFNKHLDHLKYHIGGISNGKIRKQWCKRFQDEFNRVRTKEMERKLLADVNPGFVGWLTEQISYRRS